MFKLAPKYYTFLFLAIVFSAPGVLASFFYQHSDWLGAHKVNKGHLLVTPVPLNALGSESKWKLVLWRGQGCNKKCLNALDRLARLRLALGRKLYKVEQWLVMSTAFPIISEETNVFLKAADFHLSYLSNEEERKLKRLSKKNKIFIASPKNELILDYEVGVDPQDIYKDLNVLLNASEQKSG